jgi:hypothetical protein
MAFEIAVGITAPGIKIGGTDVSDHIHSAQVVQTVAEVDVTAMGASFVQTAPGLIDGSFVVEFFQDFQSAKTDALLFPLVGSQTGATIILYSHNTTAASTAPSYTMVGTVYTYNPIDASAPGAASMTSVTFKPIQGSSITRGTT